MLASAYRRLTRLKDHPKTIRPLLLRHERVLSQLFRTHTVIIPGHVKMTFIQRWVPELTGMDHVQFEPRCPTCLVDLDRMPSSRRKCPHCQAVIYVRQLNKQPVLASREGLPELEDAQRRLRAREPKPCVACGCSIDHFWRLCPYCETWQHAADGPPRLTPEIRTRVLERQLLEASPEIHESAWVDMADWEKFLWMRRWNPPMPGYEIRLEVVAKCARCGRRLISRLCPECLPGERPGPLELPSP